MGYYSTSYMDEEKWTYHFLRYYNKSYHKFNSIYDINCGRGETSHNHYFVLSNNDYLTKRNIDSEKKTSGLFSYTENQCSNTTFTRSELNTTVKLK